MGPPMRITSVLHASLLLLPLTAACSSAPEKENASSSTSEGITTDDVMARARQWVADRVPYCGGPNGGADLICGGTCQRPSRPWDSFRSDCSGFVSWAWQISSQPDTATFVSDRGGPDGWTTIAIDDLRAGDALVTNGHNKLFSDFRGAGAADILEEFDCGQVAREKVTSFTRSGNTIWFSGDSRAYHPIRRNGISGGQPPPAAAQHELAFQANTSSLWTVGDVENKRWELGMMAGTSPAIVMLEGGGYEVAFQSNVGELWTVGSAGNANWHLGMMAGTSPSIAALAGGGYKVAFQANTGNLWTVGSSSEGDRHYGMMAGTSPSITGLAGGGYEVAFQANTGNLWTVGTQDGGDHHLGMMAGTSPSIAGLTGGGYEIAFQANTGSLWSVGNADNGDRLLGMLPGTSPAITALTNGGFQIAFQANTTSLWTTGSAGTKSWDLGMMPNTSPAIHALPNGGFRAVFQANTGDLYKADSDGIADLQLGMRNGTSPGGN